MYDSVEKIGGSLVQHGPNNDRIYLMKLNRDDYPDIIPKLDALADENKYTKIFSKIPAWAADAFEESGFRKEAYIPGFYNKKTDVFFYSKFVDPKRLIVDPETESIISKHISLALSKQNKSKSFSDKVKPPFQLRILTKDDASELTKIYQKVFRTYPFPVFEENYIRKTMDGDVIYFGVFKNNNLIAVSSSEMDIKAGAAEMTDFATDPEFTGNNLSLLLLYEMETEMKKLKIKTLYTIARCLSPGMNITFAKMGYKYSGTLINNTDISGKIESMNVWYKSST